MYYKHKPKGSARQNANMQLEKARILYDRVVGDFPIKERLLRVDSEFRLLEGVAKEFVADFDFVVKTWELDFRSKFDDNQNCYVVKLGRHGLPYPFTVYNAFKIVAIDPDAHGEVKLRTKLADESDLQALCSCDTNFVWTRDDMYIGSFSGMMTPVFSRKPSRRSDLAALHNILHGNILHVDFDDAGFPE